MSATKRYEQLIKHAEEIRAKIIKLEDLLAQTEAAIKAYENENSK